MTNAARTVIIVIASLVGAMFLWQTARGLYFAPRAQLLDRLARAESQIREREGALDSRLRVQRQLREIAQRTLGADVETVDHHLRSRLNRIIEEVGLERASVATSSPSARRSPGVNMFRGSGPLLREMRELTDFTEIDGSITGEGTLAQVIQLIDRIEAEPWIKRIHEARFNPTGQSNGERFATTIRLRTLFLPDSRVAEARGSDAGHAGPEIAAAAYDESRLVRFASLIESNPFRLPPPPAQAQPVVAQASPPVPPRFPYRQWVLTGLAEAPSGPSRAEAWLLNASNGERRVLTPGEAMGEAVFVAVRGDEAIFEIGDSQFLVQVGGNLDHRTPVNK